MPYAICQSCGQSTHYRNTRGTRLASMRCAACGGGLKGRAPSGGGGNQGKKLSTCTICGKGTYRAWMLDVPMRRKFALCPTSYLPGSVVCWNHSGDLLPATHPYFTLMDTTITRQYLLWLVEALGEWCAALPDDHPDASFYRNNAFSLRREAEKVDDDKIDYKVMGLRNAIVHFCLLGMGVGTN